MASLLLNRRTAPAAAAAAVSNFPPLPPSWRLILSPLVSLRRRYSNPQDKAGARVVVIIARSPLLRMISCITSIALIPRLLPRILYSSSSTSRHLLPPRLRQLHRRRPLSSSCCCPCHNRCHRRSRVAAAAAAALAAPTPCFSCPPAL